jgi:HPt (histidine-containing phosphotransfer) domain-containing protein
VAQYRKFLDSFVGKYADAMQVLQQHLEQADYPAAHLYAHSLKGLAASIGADAVSRAAQALESALKSADAQSVPALLEQLTGPVAGLLLAIQQDPTRPELRAAHGVTPTAPARPVDLAALVHDVQQLAVLLANDDAKAIKRLAAVEALADGSVHAATFGAIASATRAYRFADALRDLQAWAVQTGTDLRT